MLDGTLPVDATADELVDASLAVELERLLYVGNAMLKGKLPVDATEAELLSDELDALAVEVELPL